MMSGTQTIHFSGVENQFTQVGELHPLPLWKELLAFGLPTLLMAFSYHAFIPWLSGLGLETIEAFIVAHIVPMAILFSVALAVFHRLEGYPLTWKAFSQRMRYQRLTIKSALLGIGTFIALNIVYGAFSQLGDLLGGSITRPSVNTVGSIYELLDGTLSGRWDLVLLFVLLLFFNVVGEELWWRGIILPRQEKVHGQRTWLIHGLLWTAFHVFKWWDLLALLPVCLIIAYVSQRTKDNWPALIAHLLFNGMALGLLLVAVAI